MLKLDFRARVSECLRAFGFGRFSLLSGAEFVRLGACKFREGCLFGCILRVSILPGDYQYLIAADFVFPLWSLCSLWLFELVGNHHDIAY